MDQENIHLHLPTPSQTPTQIMEADEDISEIVHVNVANAAKIEDEMAHHFDSDSEHEEELNSNCINHEIKILKRDCLEDIETLKVPVIDSVTSLPLESTGNRITSLETEMKRNKSRLDGFSQELKILLVEVNIVCEWITDHFGVELIDRASQLFKHIHDFEEIEEMSQTLSLLKKGKPQPGVRRSTRRKQKRTGTALAPPPKGKRGRGRPKRKINSDSEDSELDDDETVVEAEAEEFFEPPECLLNTDVDEEFFKEDSKPKRKRIRKRPPKKVLKQEQTEVDAVDEVKEEIKEEDANANPDGRKKKKWKSQPRNLQCEECGKILKADSSLRWHMLMHADLRPVECTEPGCGKTFRDKSKLAQHYKIHGSEKNEKCRYCDRGFLRKKDLIVHERTHTGEKPYACPNCAKTFNIKDHLTIHLRVHTGERPYKCPTCDKAFSQANSLRIHKKIHLKQASDYVPAPRKPRAPRKHKSVLSVREVPPSPASASVNGGDRGDLEEVKSIELQDGVVAVIEETPSPVPVEQHSSLVPTFFQTQTLNLVDPVQQAWNFVTTPNAVVTAADSDQHHHHHQHQHQQHHQPQHVVTHQRGFHAQALGPLSVSHLSVVQAGHGAGTTFKLQPITYHTQTQQQQQQAQHSQNINIIRNPLSGQGGPFVPAQFHDPTSFRHFQN